VEVAKLGSECDGLSFGPGNEYCLSSCSKAAGLFGALLPRSGDGDFGDGSIIEERSWLEIAADLLCACRLGLLGLSFGEAKPLSDLVGLVLITVIESPERMLPPTNSLPPRLCPWFDGLGIVLGDNGDAGVCGGLKKEVSGRGGLKEAPGLKEKAGNAGDRAGRFSRVVASLVAIGISIVDLGRRPVAREYEDGADEGPDRIGKVNGGFGGG
jgi:hypothetical protein